MSRARPLLLAGLVALLAAGCHPVERPEFDALRLDYDTLEDELQTWADAMEMWGNRTKAAICDIVAKNPASYAQTTIDYCPSVTDPEGNGVPPEPDDFGAD